MASLPVLVVSCDRYADLWRPFFELFWRHWPDCRGPVYLGSNYASYDDPRVHVLRIGEDITWAASVAAMLDRIDADYLIVMLEDFLLMEPVDHARVEQLADLAMSERLGCLRLYSIYPPPRPVAGHPGLGWFAPADDYRITAQAAIWRVDTLRRLLVSGFSAWDFELIGSQMSDHMDDRIWGVYEPALKYDHGVEKGRWRPQGLAICRDAGIAVDLTSRGMFTATELERHEQTGAAAAQFAARKTHALKLFREGRRLQALSDVRWCLARRPFLAQMWVIAVVGCAGPSAVTWLQRLHVRAKVAAAERAYRRAVRRSAAGASEPRASGAPGTRQPVKRG